MIRKWYQSGTGDQKGTLKVYTKGAAAPASYSTMLGVRCTDLLSEYSAKERVISPTFFVLKVPFEVPHDCGTARFKVGMYF